MDAPSLATTSVPRFSYRYSWDPVAFRRANRLVMRHAIFPRWVRALLKVTPWFAGTVLALWLVFTVISQDWDALARSSPWLILVVGWFAFLLYGTAWLGVRAFEKRHPPGHREIEVTLDESGFHTSSHPGELRLIWDALPQVVETDEFFLFYSTAQVAHYLPKAAIPPYDLSGLRLLIAAAKDSSFKSVMGCSHAPAG